MFLCKLCCSLLWENIESIQYTRQDTDPDRYGTSSRARVIPKIEKLLTAKTILGQSRWKPTATHPSVGRGVWSSTQVQLPSLPAAAQHLNEDVAERCPDAHRGQLSALSLLYFYLTFHHIASKKITWSFIACRESARLAEVNIFWFPLWTIWYAALRESKKRILSS